MSHITLPRAVIEQVREAFKELDYASEPYVNEIARTALAALDAALAEPELQKERPDFLAGYDAGLADGRRCAERDAQDARDAAIVAAALAEPEPTVKESLTVDHIRSIWLDSWKACGNVPTPVLAEHFARQIERAHGIGLAKPINKDFLQDTSEDKVEAMMPRPAPSLAFLDGFRDGFRAAERFHGITKEDGK